VHHGGKDCVGGGMATVLETLVEDENFSIILSLVIQVSEIAMSRRSQSRSSSSDNDLDSARSVIGTRFDLIAENR
ncbi:MAG: hypothetical protein AAGL24_05805, partial [Pseudomonadota bacterium]